MKQHSFNTIKLGRILFLLLLLPLISTAQVGINTTSPAAGSILDVSSGTSGDKGMLVPRVNIADLTTIAPITGGAPAGLLVYNTNTTTGPGFVYWDGGNWSTVDGGQDWKKSGNAATTPGTDYIGTTDAVDFVIGTAATERARVLANGQVSINNPAPVAGDRLTVTGASTESAINGYASGGGLGVYGEETGGGIGVFGNTNGVGWGLTGQNNGTGIGAIGFSANTGVGVQGQNSGTGVGVFGVNTTTGIGVQGQNNTTGVGVFGVSQSWNGVQGLSAADGTGFGVGVYGIAIDAFGVGVIAENLAETGLIASGAGASTAYITNTGATFNAGTLGAVALTTDAAGTGIMGLGNASTNLITAANGAGVSAVGINTGIYAYAGAGDLIVANQGNAAGVFQLDTDDDPSTAGNDDIRAQAILAGFDNADPDGGGVVSANDIYFGGYFSGGNESGTPGYAFVGARYSPTATGNTNGGSTDYKIIGTGSVSTLINDSENNPRVMFAPEAPEIVFQDYGTGQLTNGVANILIDPVLKKSIHVDAQHPLKVFVTLEGDCNGVYVTNKSADGFTVKELQGGTSNVPFSWQIVANRADRLDASGKVVSKHVGLRLPNGPKARKVKTKRAQDINHEVKQLDRSKAIEASAKEAASLPQNIKKITSEKE